MDTLYSFCYTEIKLVGTDKSGWSEFLIKRTKCQMMSKQEGFMLDVNNMFIEDMQYKE